MLGASFLMLVSEKLMKLSVAVFQILPLLTLGAIVGLSEVLLNQLRARTLIADTIVEVYQIEAEAFRGIVDKHPVVSKRAWQMAAAFLTALNPWGDFKDASFDAMQKHFR